jgi:hypothetical protein
MERYNQDLRAGKSMPYFDAVARLEQAGILQALEAPVAGISPRRAAAILNDYGFLVWKKQARLTWAEPALRRAIALDPRRALARLNLADGLRESLPALTDFAVKQQRVAEIAALYRKYLVLGGKSQAHITSFLKGSLAGVGTTDICHAIVSYANAGRLQELVSDVGINITSGGRRLDLVFTTEGTAHVPTVYAFDANTDIPLHEDALSVPGIEGLWGGDQLGWVVYRDTTHILHYRDFRHPVATSPLSGGAACNFRATTVEKIGPKASELALCRSLSTGQGPPAIAFDTPAPIAWEDVRERYSETIAGRMRRLNFANDGQLATIAEMQLSSGAGAGCGAEFYDLLDTTGQRLVSGPQHALLMQLQNANPSHRYPILCGNKARFFTYHGKIYFENKPATWPPIDDLNQYHRVARIGRGSVVDRVRF